MLSCLIICYGPLLITCNCNYFLLQLYGEPSQLQRYVKVVISISHEAVEFIKLLFLYLKQNDKMGQFIKHIGQNGNFPYVSNLIMINTKLQCNLKRYVIIIAKTCWRIV